VKVAKSDLLRSVFALALGAGVSFVGAAARAGGTLRKL
jgi:hypothetical protein